MTGRVKKCMICGLSDGHTLIDCPYRCHFCGESVNVCDCVNSSLVDGVLASETPDKMSKVSKRKADTDDSSEESKRKKEKDELRDVLARMKQMNELFKKREKEHMETVAAMQKRIEELEGAAVSKGERSGDESSESVDSDEEADGSGSEHNEPETKNTRELITGSNLQGIHERYQAVLDILVDNQCSLTEAMRRFNIPRNTLRDYIGICELRIIDGERYKRVVEAERQKMGKVSAKTIEQRCRAVLNDYRVQANTLKQQKKLLPFYPKEDFYTSK